MTRLSKLIAVWLSIWAMLGPDAAGYADSPTDAEQIAPSNDGAAIAHPHDDAPRDPYIDQPLTDDADKTEALYGDQDALRSGDLRRTEDGPADDGAQADARPHGHDGPAADDAIEVPLTSDPAAGDDPDALARALGRSGNARRQSDAAERSGVDRADDRPGSEISPGIGLRVIIPSGSGTRPVIIQTPEP